jgi:hypothetical protein
MYLIILIFKFEQMKLPADIRYTEEMLSEAMDMLEGLQHHMGLFQRQYYGKLKTRFTQHDSICKDLKKRLNEIDTTEDNRGGVCCG